MRINFRPSLVLISLLLIVFTIGVIYYSTFFLNMPNQNFVIKKTKILVASFHLFVLLIPMLMSLSSRKTVAVVGLFFTVLTILYLVFQLSFYKYFNFLPNIFSYSVDSVKDVSDVSAHYFEQVFGMKEIILLVMFSLYMLVFVCAHSGLLSIYTYEIKALYFAGLFIPIILLCFSVMAYGTLRHSNSEGATTKLRRFGPVVHFVDDFMDFRKRRSSEYLVPASPFPGRLSELVSAENNPVIEITDLSKLQDIYLFQIESLDSFVIDAELNDNLIMPFLHDFQKQCVNFENHFTLKGVGGSADAEFAIITGLLPLTQRQSIRNADASNLSTIFQSLADNEVQSYFAHYNEIGFYGRNNFYLNLESVDIEFASDFSESEYEFAVRTLSKAVFDQKKSFYYFFNVQSHGPYNGYQRERNTLGERPEAMPSIQYDYYRSLNEVDVTIQALFNTQKEGFLNGENVILITSDHPSNLFIEDDPYSLYRIPLLICHNSFTPQIATNVSSQVDLFPTILGLFGLSKQAIGANILSQESSAVILPKSNKIIFNQAGKLVSIACDADCEKIRSYTDQFIFH